MAEQFFSERRTRSQLTLQDGSKKAPSTRTAHLNIPQPQPADEARQKRSLSPEGTPTRYSDPPLERQVKRAKRALGSVPRKRTGRGTHARIVSDPNARRGRSTRKHSTPPTVPAPVADARSSVESEPRPANARAQSVPLFPTSYSFPFIDLKNPPPSPRRAQSRSPEKEERKLDIIFEPIKLDVPVEEKMQVEENASSTLQDVPLNDGQASTMPKTIQTHTTITTDPYNSSSASPAKHKSFTTQYVPSTPAPLRPNLLVALSPLTPLSETPQLLKSKNAGLPGQKVSSRLSNSQEYVKPQPAGTSQMGLISGNLETHVLPPPLLQSRSEDTTLKGPPPGIQRNGFVVPGRKSSKSSDSDAFSIMMRASQEKTNLPTAPDKGKQRVGVRSSAGNHPKMSNFGPTVKNGGSSSKLKSRMRPREKPKIEPILKLLVPLESDSETDERLGRNHEPTTDEGVSNSTPPIEQSLSPDSAPHPAIDTAKRREPESSLMDDTKSDIRLITTTQPVSPPEEPVDDSLSEPLFGDMRPAVESRNVIPPISQDVSLPQHLPEEPTHHPIEEASSADASPVVPSITQDVGDKPLTESVKDLELQEESLPPEPADMDCDQPAGIDPEQERRPSQIPKVVVVPVSRTNSRRGAIRSNQKKTTITTVRMTRSTASKLKTAESSVTRSALRSNIAVTPRITRLRSASVASPSGKSVPDVQRKGSPSKAALTSDATSSSGLPVKSSNYARPTTSSTAKVTKTPTKPPRPSAFKPSRASSTAGSRASSPLSRSFSTNSLSDLAVPSSLSTLSTALEKLRMPPPTRPSTSTGFYYASDDSGTSAVLAHDGSKTEAAGLGKGLPSTNAKLRRRSSSFTLPTSTYNVGTAKSQSTVQQPISTFFALKESTSTGSDGLSKPSKGNPQKPRIFGVGNRGVFGMGTRGRAPKVSRKTSLPMVVGSPVKGGEPKDDDSGKDGMDDSLEIVMSSAPDTASLGEDEYFVPIAGDSSKGAGKKKEKDDDGLRDRSSGRASLALLGLSASLSALPPKGSMGPPPIPRHGRVTRSVSSGYASTSHANSPEDEDDKSKANGLNNVGSPLKILKNCVVYVDVRTDDGDDAGSLFVEMLESAGAKLLTRVGQTCTHIIFKNGLLSTMSRYRLLRDPKPHVVGIAWIVECMQQGKHVDESKFLIDLSDINVAGVQKRRKSLLPKLVADDLDGIATQESDHSPEDGDRSMDGSNSSLILDDLPPLERARRRKSFLLGPRP